MDYKVGELVYRKRMPFQNTESDTMLRVVEIDLAKEWVWIVNEDGKKVWGPLGDYESVNKRLLKEAMGVKND